MVNLKSVFFLAIMLSHKDLTLVHSQKKPRLHFGESFALKQQLLTQKGQTVRRTCTHTNIQTQTHTHVHHVHVMYTTSQKFGDTSHLMVLFSRLFIL